MSTPSDPLPLNWLPVQHRMTRRKFGHDYSAVGTYMLTLVVANRWHAFGEVRGDVKAPRTSPQWAHLELSPLGQRVLQEEIPKIHHFYPMVFVWKVQLMPDHLHLILRVASEIPAPHGLGQVVRGFKTGCSRAWWDIQSSLSPSLPEQSSAPKPVLFENGYNDKILMRDGQLERWKHYLDENPLRLLIRRTYPDFMHRALCLTINGTRYSAFGNFLLLKRPDKLQVFCHRSARYGQLNEAELAAAGLNTGSYSPLYTTKVPYLHTAAFAAEREECLSAAEQGTVLVTPGISPGECTIKNDAIANRLPLIHIQDKPITRLWKPENERFYACSEGSLLILAPWPEDLAGDSQYTRFHNMNDLAASIVAMDTMEGGMCYREI